MEKVERKIKLYIQLGSFAFIWATLLFLSETSSVADLFLIAKKFPQAVTIYVFVSLFFIKWGWRWKIFQGWLIKIPDLQGTWHGELQSTWVDPSTKKPITIPALLVIKQSFSSIDCVLHSPESSSYSIAAQINRNQGGTLYLSYTYTNRPKLSIRDRSQMHDGTAILRIIRKPVMSLEGEYWTSRQTTGDIKFKFKSDKLAEKYA